MDLDVVRARVRQLRSDPDTEVARTAGAPPAPRVQAATDAAAGSVPVTVGGDGSCDVAPEGAASLDAAVGPDSSAASQGSVDALTERLAVSVLEDHAGDGTTEAPTVALHDANVPVDTATATATSSPGVAARLEDVSLELPAATPADPAFASSGTRADPMALASVAPSAQQ